MIELRQSTEIIEKVGPIVNSTGVTPVTGLTIDAADEAEILKAGTSGTLAIAGTLTAVTSCDGYYNLTLSSGDTSALGALKVVIQDDNVCLPYFKDYMVVGQSFYDAKYNSTGAIKADIRQIGGSVTTALSDFKATGFSTFDPTNTPVSLGTIVYASLGAFHASVTGYSTFDPAATGVTLGSAIYTAIADFRATGFSTFDPAATGVSLGSAVYTAITDFRATGFSTFDPASDGVTLGSAVYTAIGDFRATAVSLTTIIYASIGAFMASVTGYSTFDPTSNGVSLGSAIYTAIADFKATGFSTFDPTSDEVSLSAASVDAVLDDVVEGAITLRQATRLFLSVLTGKVSGGSTTTLTFRDTGDTKNRLVVTVDANKNRTAVGTRDGT